MEPIIIKIDYRKTAEELVKLAHDGVYPEGSFWIGGAQFAKPEKGQSRVDLVERALQLGWQPTFKEEV